MADTLASGWRQFPQMRDTARLGLGYFLFAATVGTLVHLGYGDDVILSSIGQSIGWAQQNLSFYPEAAVLDNPAVNAGARYLHFGALLTLATALFLSVTKIVIYTRALASYPGNDVTLRNWLYEPLSGPFFAAIVFLLFFMAPFDYYFLTLDAVADAAARRNPSRLIGLMFYGVSEIGAVIAWTAFSFANSLILLWSVPMIAYGFGVRPRKIA